MATPALNGVKDALGYDIFGPACLIWSTEIRHLRQFSSKPGCQRVGI